jgi:hypothetical protein
MAVDQAAKEIAIASAPDESRPSGAVKREPKTVKQCCLAAAVERTEQHQGSAWRGA